MSEDDFLFEETTQEQMLQSDWPWKEAVDPKIYQELADWPKISVVIPSFNQGAFLEKTIRSILQQHYPNLELILVDGGSSDSSLDIIERYKSQFTYWVSESDRGQSHAINKGLAKSTGSILTWLNSDDLYAPHALYHVAKEFLQGQEVGLIVGLGHKVNKDGDIIYSPNPETISYENVIRWMQGNNFMQPAAFFTNAAWKECGPLNEKLHFCMDVDLWIRILEKFPVSRVNQTLALALAHEDAKTTAQVEEMRIETALLIASHQELEIAKFEIERLLEPYKEDRKRIEKIRMIPFFKVLKKLLKKSFFESRKV